MLVVNQKWFVFFAFLFFIAGVYHLISLFIHLNDEPGWRNLLFVFINAMGIFGVLKRPKFFIYFFFFWMLQQLYSHGCTALLTWTHEHSIDKIGLLVILTMPTVFVFLLMDRRKSMR